MRTYKTDLEISEVFELRIRKCLIMYKQLTFLKYQCLKNINLYFLCTN